MESWMPFFVGVTAVAIVLQAIILIALFVQIRRTAALVERTVTDLNTKLNPLISRVQVLVEDISPRISGIVADASEISRLARAEAQKIDRILSEALERLRMQLIHVDHILTGAMESSSWTSARESRAEVPKSRSSSANCVSTTTSYTVPAGSLARTQSSGIRTISSWVTRSFRQNSIWVTSRGYL